MDGAWTAATLRWLARGAGLERKGVGVARAFVRRVLKERQRARDGETRDVRGLHGPLLAVLGVILAVGTSVLALLTGDPTLLLGTLHGSAIASMGAYFVRVGQQPNPFLALAYLFALAGLVISGYLLAAGGDVGWDLLLAIWMLMSLTFVWWWFRR